MEEYKIENFVAYNKRVYTIKSIKDGSATIGDDVKVNCEELKPIKIGSSLDSRITLINDLLRYPPISGPVPISKFNYYLDCYVSKEKTLRDVIQENPQIKYLHQLQEWLAVNTDGFHLQS